MLGTIAGGGAVLLAGCDGDGEGTTAPGGNGNGNGTGTVDATLYYPGLVQNQADLHYNPWSFQNAAYREFFWGALTVEKFVLYTANTYEIHPGLAEDWSVEDGVIEVTLREGQTFHDGTPLTTEHEAVRRDIDRQIARHNGTFEDLRWSDYEVVDDHVIRFQLRDDYSEVVAMQSVVEEEFGQCINANNDRPSHWHDRLTNLEPGTDEMDEAITELRQDREFEHVGSGPFQIDNVGNNTVTLTKWDDYYNADNINFGTVDVTYHQDKLQAFLSEETDLTSSGYPLVDESLQQQEPDEVQMYHRDTSLMYMVAINNGYQMDTSKDTFHGATSDRRVRQAIACLVDPQQAAQNLADGSNPADYPLQNTPPSNVGEVNTDGFVHYTEMGTAGAEDYLSMSDDYHLEGGQVVDNDGEQVELTYLSQSGAHLRLAQTFQSWLEDFGFSVTIDAGSDVDIGARRGNGDYDLFGDNNGPTGIYDAWRSQSYWAWLQGIWHFPSQPEIPMPVGDPEGSLEPYDWLDRTNALALADDDDEFLEIARELSWFFNQQIVAIVPAWKPTPGALNATRFEIQGENRPRRDSRHMYTNMLRGGCCLAALPDG